MRFWSFGNTAREQREQCFWWICKPIFRSKNTQKQLCCSRCSLLFPKWTFHREHSFTQFSGLKNDWNQAKNLHIFRGSNSRTTSNLGRPETKPAPRWLLVYQDSPKQTTGKTINQSDLSDDDELSKWRIWISTSWVLDEHPRTKLRKKLNGNQ